MDAKRASLLRVLAAELRAEQRDEITMLPVPFVESLE
jgi:hypothetical protein